MAETVRISARKLVEYVYLTGSIESGFKHAVALQEGTKAHQQVQKHYKDGDGREVSLKTELLYEEVVFNLEGRADGILFHEGDMPTIDEIKSTSGDLSYIAEETYPVHWAQAQCYAYMYAVKEGLPSMRVQLTYYQIQTEEMKRFERVYSLDALTEHIWEMVRGYAPRAFVELRHSRERDASIKALSFPYEAYRRGQRAFAGAVYKTHLDSRRLFAGAPTGMGKTMSTLFPTIKAIGEGVLRRLFYLTAKTLTRTAAEEAISLMEQKGLHMWSVTLTAKDKICFQVKVDCRKESCPFADGHYDRLNGALLDLLTNETRLNRSVIEAYARKHRVCPFEFALDAAYAADVVVCDYNYIFDPRVSLKRLWEEEKRHTALLIDEAHNLVDRAREMYSAEVAKAAFLALQRTYKGRNHGLYAAAHAINHFLIKVKKDYTATNSSTATQADGGLGVNGMNAIRRTHAQVNRELPQELVELLTAFLIVAERELASGNAGAIAPTGIEGTEGTVQLLDIYFAVRHFVRIAADYDERYVTITELVKGELSVKLFCLDPSRLLQKAGKGFRSTVFFSATLAPLSYFQDLLGGEPEDYAVSFPSPFYQEQLSVFISPLSTRYRDREHTKERIAAQLVDLTQQHLGNYLVFFPSYDYMFGVLASFMKYELDAEVIVQNNHMSEEERQAYLAAFHEGRQRPLIGFAVMGGIFGESIDLTGERLTGVIIVGVGLPQIGTERDIIRTYFDEVGKNGYDYAYVYPGMNKVLQAGGRLIRTKTDQGTLMLVDDRFLQPKYQMLIPEEWKPATILR
ncbi:MAG: ATP-dependent DNA helicase [Gorillibacterium sp.]|nr:ATP-dependent DNA helicase [Gorillibacterium sp.]